MLETYAAILTNVSRNLKRNIRESPILYSWFGFMMVSSVVMMVYITLFIIQTETEIQFDELFFAIFFIFMMKTTADVHKHYLTSQPVTYILSTQVSQRKTVFELFLFIFWTELGIWALFSSLFTVFIHIAGVQLGYPLEYLTITLGVILAAILGTTISLHFFSPKRLRLIPAVGLVSFLWYFHDIYSIIFAIGLSACYLAWSLNHTLDSYLFVSRKKRQKEKFQVWIRDSLKAIFYKETVVLWRDKLLFSFIFTAAITGFFTGYLAVFGDELLIPESLRESAQGMLPAIYVFLGVYIVVIYTSVFPALNTFLAEEETIWIIRHLPVSEKTFVKGKVLALGLTLFSSIPFIAYYAAFTGTEYLLFASWFLVYSFIIGVIIALPLGAKYMGKKSDILVLYSVAMIVFVILAVTVAIENVFSRILGLDILFYVLSILFAIGFLLLSIQLSAQIFSLKFPKVHHS